MRNSFSELLQTKELIGTKLNFEGNILLIFVI